VAGQALMATDQFWFSDSRQRLTWHGRTADLKSLFQQKENLPELKDLNIKIESDELLKAINPCIANILLQFKDLNHSYNERFIIITYLLWELGYSETMVEDTLKKFMTNKKYNHCIKDERQIKYLSKRFIMPVGCAKIKSMGYCPFADNKRCKGFGKK
jgi:hypothetical protein